MFGLGNYQNKYNDTSKIRDKMIRQSIIRTLIEESADLKKEKAQPPNKHARKKPGNDFWL